jgi:hypothetical protein
VAPWYNLPERRRYRERRMSRVKTRPVQVAVGEQPKPEPPGQPGYVRVDTVHQGDRDGIKNVHSINTVDEVTQWQAMGSPRRSGRRGCCRYWRRPGQFPFHLRGFPSDMVASLSIIRCPSC